MRNRKLKAFTLLELTIAMLISAISIGMAFYMFQYFQQLFLAQQKQRQERFSYSLLKHLLQQDIDRAVWLKSDVNGLICVSGKGRISYEFDAQYIVRHQYDSHQDTFQIATIDFDTTARLENLPMDDLTDHLSLRIKFEDNEHRFEYNKTYSAQQLIQPELYNYE
ncbi:type II secretion system GspH family protein [Sphingobacterium sp. InxBP1]|uniref:PulJ/GspJ family protein n=1 Tax=Sphingobacterium sp. InxBP1 TaxID=2870328 RepID=UPI002244EFD2|nr:type II secretion system protein [Sphingobacterium sp. InxBP1]MCW8311106.1 type II secretion system GspH family protein [Sphingobacterium sp. InxBP1]